jgi:hypothetical protein
VVDGQSDDGTRDIARGLADRFPHVRLIDYPRRITPAALNVGLAQARRETIIRMDAHATYFWFTTWCPTTPARRSGGAPGYQYGLFRPLVSRKVGRVLTLRQRPGALREPASVELA